jgi:branched-chain amino acid transport system substrate-binding protein
MNRHTVRSRLIPAAALVAAAITLAACSSSSGSAGSSAAGNTTGNTDANTASGSTWVIGNIGSYSGPNASAYGNAGQVLQAWADSVNASGGIKGHQVKVVVMDDGNSASTALSEAQELVQQDHVLAIVGEMSSPAETWASYVQQQGVPVIGGNTIDPVFDSNPDFFPVGATPDQSVYDAIAATKATGPRGSVFYCTENPACAALVPGVRSAYTRAGGSLVLPAPISVTAPDYTAECLAAKGDHVQSVIIYAPATTQLSIAQNCATQGYFPTLMGDGVSFTQQFASSFSGVSGAKILISDDVFPFFEQSTPAEQAFHSALAKYAPSVLAPATFTENDATEWASAQLFAAAAQKLTSAEPTPSQLTSALYGLSGTTVSGLTPPLHFQQGKPSSVSCIYVVTVASGKFTTPDGSQLFCP